LSSGCPQLEQLRAFFLGQMADAELEEIARHLEQCPTCLHRMSQNSADDSLLQTCRGEQVNTPADSSPPDLKRLVSQLKQMSSGGVLPSPADPIVLASHSSPTAAAVPAVLLGRYRILQKVGAGGMGTVYQAQDEQLGRVVAVKVPHFPGSAHDQSRSLQRFLREVRLAAQVRHPNICTIHDVGEDQGIPFVVMEYIAGWSLDVELQRRRRFDHVGHAVQLAAQIARALEAVHRCGIIHRDLKPANVLLHENGQAMLTDFGLAATTEPHIRLTSEGYAVGTPTHMAPEQLTANAEVDHRADLYALGLVLYQMVTGRMPFEGTVREQVWQRVAREAAPATTFRPELDARLDAILRKALAQKPDERYSSAGELAEALELWLAGIPMATPVATLLPRRSYRRPLVVAAGVALTAIPLLIWVFTRSPKPPTQAVVATRPQTTAGPTAPAVGTTPVRAFSLGYVNRALFVPTSTLLAISTPGNQIQIIDPQGGVALHQLAGHGPCQLWGFAISADGEHILSGGDDRAIFLWSRESQGVLQRFMGHEGSIKRVAFVPKKERIVSAADDDTVRTWDMRTGKELSQFRLRLDGRSINATAFSADGSQFLSGRGDGFIELYEVGTGKQLHRWRAHDDAVCSVVFSADGKQALTGGADKRVRLWDLDKTKLLANLEGQNERPGILTFVPGRRQALSSDTTGTIYLWDLDTPRLLCRWTGHRYELTSLCVTPSGKEFLSMSGYGELMMWKLPPR
jgi:hypothetical protein